MYCLDTNVIIFAVNKRRPEIAKRLDEELAADTQLAIPTVVLHELWCGIAKSSQSERAAAVLTAFLSDRFTILPFGIDEAREAADVRAGLETRGLPIGPYDILIAAQARRRGLILVTCNRREFDRVPRLMVTSWSDEADT